MKALAIVILYFALLFAIVSNVNAAVGTRYRSHSEKHHSADRHTAKQAEKARAKRARGHN